MITNSNVINWFDHLFCKRLHTYESPRSYIYMADTLFIIGPIAETTLNFIINSRYKNFEYWIFQLERIGKYGLTFKSHFQFPIFCVIIRRDLIIGRDVPETCR